MPIKRQKDMRSNVKVVLQRIAIISVATVSVGCAALQPESSTSAPAVGIEGTTTGEAALARGSVRYDTEDERVAKLWSAAEQARIEQNTDLALQRLFEALELQPQNGLLWSRAAELQLDNQQAVVAENFAVRSNGFAGDNESLLHRNWLIIEHARSLRGDLLGVRSAHKKVQEYQYR